MGLLWYKVVSPAPRARWRELLGQDPDALPSHAPEFIDAMCARSLWRDASRLYMTDEGRSFVLPMVRFGPARRFFAVEASPRPGWGYGGIVAPGGVTSADLAVVADDFARHRPLRRTIRPNPSQVEAWSTFTGMQRVPTMAHVIDLESGLDDVYKRFNRNAKRNIKIAEKAGVVVEIDRTGRLLRDFFTMYEMSSSRWASQQNEPQWIARLRYHHQDSIEKWQTISEHLGPRCAVLIARVDGQPAAGGILLFGADAHYTRAAMNAELAAPTRATDALEWEVIKEASASGARRLHTGHSATPGVAAFKERFGAVRIAYDEFFSERLPFRRADAAIRSVVKRTIGFDEEAQNRHPSVGSGARGGEVVGAYSGVGAAVHDDHGAAEERSFGRQEIHEQPRDLFDATGP